MILNELKRYVTTPKTRDWIPVVGIASFQKTNLSERLNVRTSRRLGVRTSGRPEIWRSGRLAIWTSEHLDVRTSGPAKS